MKLENSPPPNRDTQKKENENIKNIQKERLRIKPNNLNHKSFYYFIFENLIHEGNLTIYVSC